MPERDEGRRLEDLLVTEPDIAQPCNVPLGRRIGVAHDLTCPVSERGLPLGQRGRGAPAMTCAAVASSVSVARRVPQASEQYESLRSAAVAVTRTAQSRSASAEDPSGSLEAL